MSENAGVAEAIQRAGSQMNLAEALGISQAAVSRMLHNRVSAERAVVLENLFGVPRETTRPDIFAKCDKP